MSLTKCWSHTECPFCFSRLSSNSINLHTWVDDFFSTHIIRFVTKNGTEPMAIENLNNGFRSLNDLKIREKDLVISFLRENIGDDIC